MGGSPGRARSTFCLQLSAAYACVRGSDWRALRHAAPARGPRVPPSIPAGSEGLEPQLEVAVVQLSEKLVQVAAKDAR